MSPRPVRSALICSATTALAAAALVVCRDSTHAQVPAPPSSPASLAVTATNLNQGLTTRSFEGREWLLGINARVSEDEGKAVLSVKGGQGGRGGAGARPIGHVAIAKGIALKEGTIEFEMKSAQLNQVGHNYIGVIFRVQDQLRYEVLYLRFCPGQLAGIQFASVSDGTDPWQQFRQPQYTRYGVFPDKTWIKIRIEVRGDRMLLYMNGESKPALDLDRLPGGYPAGSVGFWAFPSSGEGLFRNLRVTPGPLPGPEPVRGELSILPTPPDTASPSTPTPPGRRNQRGRPAQTNNASIRMEPPSQPGTIDRTQWASRRMQGAKWEMADLDAGAVRNGVLQVAGSADAQRHQVIYKAAQFTGDFDLTAQYRGNCRIGLVCADGQRGFIGIQNTLDKRGELRISRAGSKVEFTLNSQPATYTKALTSEEAPFYFGAILDSGMQCDMSSIKIAQPAQP